MKGFLSGVCATMLCICLLFTTLWRNDRLPDFSGLVDWIKNAKEQADDLWEKTGQMIDNATNGGHGTAPALPKEQSGNNKYEGYNPSIEISSDLLTLIRETYDHYEQELDLTAYDLTPDQLKAAISEVRYSDPEYFYVSNQYNLSTSTVTGFVTTFAPIYLVDEEAADQQMQEYDGFVRQIASGVPADADDFERVLYLHDYFVKNFEYDYDYEIRDAYTFFKEGEGVCQAYMLAFIAVAEELGIDSIPVTSEEMNHAWNLVEIDGEWYHMDITWDDSASHPAAISYAYFLHSDNSITAYDEARTDDPAEIHRDWMAASAASDTKYDRAVWRESVAQITVLNGNYYCVLPSEEGSGGFIYGGESPVDMEEVFEIESTWRYRNTNSYYPGCYSGLAACGNELIYNNNKVVRAYNVKTGKDRLVGVLGLRQVESIFGFCDFDPTSKKLTLFVAEGLDVNNSFKTVEYVIP